MQYIAAQLTNPEDTQKLKQEFMKIDQEGNGRLNQRQLYKALNNLYGKMLTKEQVEQIFNEIDLDESGYIEWNEFILAGIDKKILLDPEKIVITFNKIDTQNEGKVNPKMIQEFFRQQLDERTVQSIFEEADQNKDGFLDIQEFTQAILSEI